MWPYLELLVFLILGVSRLIFLIFVQCLRSKPKTYKSKLILSFFHSASNFFCLSDQAHIAGVTSGEARGQLKGSSEEEDDL